RRMPCPPRRRARARARRAARRSPGAGPRRRGAGRARRASAGTRTDRGACTCCRRDTRPRARTRAAAAPKAGAPPTGPPGPSAPPRPPPACRSRAGRAPRSRRAGTRGRRRRRRPPRAPRGRGGDPSRARSCCRRRFDKPLYPRDRNANPVGAVVELVAELVHRLLELEDRQEPLDRGLARGEERLVDGGEVAVEEAAARLLLPAVRGGDSPQILGRG